MDKPVLVIVGPTAVGKSFLAMRLAQETGGEIISADSRQVYRYMDIGTAKPTDEDRRRVPHHLIDLVDPDETYSLALFLRHARRALDEVLGRGKTPIVVGGTGQYIWGLVEGWQVPSVPPDPELRARLEDRASRQGVGTLYQELVALAPEVARRIDPRNPRRVIRALEVRLKGPGASLRRKEPPPYRFVLLGLFLPREELYGRADARIQTMMGSGWLDEVRRLLAMGYDLDLPAMSGVGYRELGLHIQGRLTLEEALSKTRTRTHRFIRHQGAWFRPSDPRLVGFQASPRGMDEALRYALESLRRG